MKKKMHIIAGARPNFMKIAPIARALVELDGRLDYRIIHTGQHYDREMSEVFFKELSIPLPHQHLEVGSGSHAAQTAKIMVSYETVCLEDRPDVVIVVGDVNSTLACSLVAKKLNIAVAHVEAGLRSGDMTMPEEINRIVTDAISDYLFVTERSGIDNLVREGKASDKVFFVGHVMIDNLYYQLGKLKNMDASELKSSRIKQALGRYGVVTLHRPANVDDASTLRRLMAALVEISMELPLVFPVHPRTKAMLDQDGIALPATIRMTPPLSFMDFLQLWKDAVMVLTDSGGLQEETTALGVPCLTLRDNTERPITLTEGTNVLVGTDPDRMMTEVRRVLVGGGKAERVPELWDGKAAQRIAQILTEKIGV
jgi:UDP-N-acetylglucosamine 2-epimerase (non-hydrolysing)